MIDIEERVQRLKRPVWIGYGRSVEIRDRLDELLAYPKSHRMPNLAIIARSNNGKSALLSAWREKHPIKTGPNVDWEIPVFLMEMPPEADEGRFYMEALAQLGLSGSPREPVVEKLTRLCIQLTQLRTKAFVIDEFNHAVRGSPSRQSKFLNAIKSLGNRLRIPIIVAGTEQALHAIQSDPQLANRFQPEVLPRWRAGDEYDRLLLSLDQSFELKGSYKLTKGFAERVLDESEGLIGDIVDLMTRMAIQAVRSGNEVLSKDQLSAQNLLALKWRRPSERTRFVD